MAFSGHRFGVHLYLFPPLVQSVSGLKRLCYVSFAQNGARYREINSPKLYCRDAMQAFE